MHQTRGAAVRPIVTLLSLAMFLPIITGFTNAAPDSGAAVAPEAIPAPAVQSPPTAAPQAVETPAETRFNWRRDKEPEPGAADSAGPGTSTTEAGFAPKKIHSWETGASTEATTTCHQPPFASRPRPFRWARPVSTGWPRI